jgi:hypothetical protein
MPASAATAAVTHSPSGEGAATPHRRLTYHDRAIIVALRKVDTTHEAIAAQLGCSIKSVSRALALHKLDSKAATTELLQTGVLDRLTDWNRAAKVAAKKGDHRPSKDWLVAAGSIDADANTSVTLNFQAVVAPRPGLPSFAALAEPALDADVVLSSADTQRRPVSDPALEASSRIRR